MKEWQVTITKTSSNTYEPISWYLISIFLEKLPDKGIESYIKSIPDSTARESPIKLKKVIREQLDSGDESFRRENNADLSNVLDTKPTR